MVFILRSLPLLTHLSSPFLKDRVTKGSQWEVFVSHRPSLSSGCDILRGSGEQIVSSFPPSSSPAHDKDDYDEDDYIVFFHESMFLAS